MRAASQGRKDQGRCSQQVSKWAIDSPVGYCRELYHLVESTWINMDPDENRETEFWVGDKSESWAAYFHL